MRNRTITILLATVVPLAVLWVAGSAIAGPLNTNSETYSVYGESESSPDAGTFGWASAIKRDLAGPSEAEFGTPFWPEEQGQAAQGDTTINPRLPFVRNEHSTIYDAAHNRLITFGGWNGRRFFNDVWALDPTPGSEAWTQIDCEGVPPPPRGQHTAIYDATNGRMIIFGGHSRYLNYNDVWALDLTPGAETWQEITPAGPTVPPRRWHTAIYDSANGRMVVFGGGGGGTLLNDTWALSLTPGSETWTQLALDGSPPPIRAQHTAICDAANGQMVVFGGAVEDALQNDAWVLDLTTETWTQLSPTGAPPSARRGHSAIYDAANSRMLAFGGVGSGGFYNDLWSLTLTPGAVAWTQLVPEGTVPSGRAWHTATVDAGHNRMIVIGGRGMGPGGGAHWALDLSTLAWSPFTPTLPSWSQVGTFQAAETQTDGSPQVTLEVEDALPNTMVNLLSNSEVWFVAKLRSPSATYASNITVTLNLPSAQFDSVQVGTRHKDLEDVTSWSTPTSPSSGRYRKTGVSLTKLSGESDYSTQVVFKAHVKGDAAEGAVNNLYVTAKGVNWSRRLEDYAYARIYRDPQAWIITNRTVLSNTYASADVQSLLDEVFEQAQGSGYNSNPTAVVLYADRYVPSLKTWDNRNVNYTSETTANTVADAVADWLVNWVVSWTPYPTFAYPEYLVIVGDDNVIPFYRKHEYGADGIHVPRDNSEDDAPNCWGGEVVCDNLVSHNYSMTDNPYGDQSYGTVRQDWEQGNLEASVGRIVGISAGDMQYFLRNAVSGPNAGTNRAIIASDGIDWWVPGADNDPQNILKIFMGYSVNESLIDASPTKANVVNEMTPGFAVAALAHHGETYVWQLPGLGPGGTIEYLWSDEFPQYDPQNKMPTNRPFFYFCACRVGYSYTSGWDPPNYYDDSMVYALVHRGASGVVASAGLAYGNFTNNSIGNSETLSNNFWKQAKAYPDRSNSLGWSLKQAKAEHPVDDNITAKKTVQTFTYFGVPWMRLPGHGTTSASAVAAPQADAAATAWSAPMLIQPSGYTPAALQATYVVTAHINASNYAITQTTDGFDLIEIQGLTQRAQDGQPVLPYATMELVLPLSATVTSLVFTPTQPVTLTNLNIPTLLEGVLIPGGPRGGYTTTITGTFPVTASLNIRTLDTYQLVRVFVIPVTYDAVTDQAILYRSADVQVQYETPHTLALTFFDLDKVRYVPGDTINAAARIINAGTVAETVTATLTLHDAQGQLAGFQSSGPLVVPAGGSYDLSLGWTGPLEGDAYRVRLLIWQGGQVVAGAGREAFVTSGAITDLPVPQALWPDQTGTFAVTFTNYSARSEIAIASLAIFDADDTMVAFLEPQAAAVAGEASATFNFAWTPQTSGTYVASAVVAAGGEEYGPKSESVNVGYRVYLPLALKASQ